MGRSDGGGGLMYSARHPRILELGATRVSPLWELYLGSLVDARAWAGERLSVHENPVDYPRGPDDACIAILQARPRGSASRPEQFWASRSQLERASSHISARLAAGVRLLVHCGGGVERSPLTIAWWLVRTGECQDLCAAYAMLRATRDIVADRTRWLEALP